MKSSSTFQVTTLVDGSLVEFRRWRGSLSALSIFHSIIHTQQTVETHFTEFEHYSECILSSMVKAKTSLLIF